MTGDCPGSGKQELALGAAGSQLAFGVGQCDWYSAAAAAAVGALHCKELHTTHGRAQLACHELLH